MTTENTYCAMFACQPPGQFDFSNINDWPSWRSRFERFRSVSGLSSKSEVENVDCLVYIMGAQAESILTALKLSEEDGKSYDKVLGAFETHFIGKRNTIYERAKFNGRIQTESETVDEFITSLHNLAKHCSFGELTDELIRDRIVAGVLDRNLSEKMQLDSNLTLERATTMARQSERVKSQQSIVHLDAKQDIAKHVEVDRVNAPYYKNSNNNVALRYNNENKNSDKTAPKFQNLKNNGNSKNSCHFCGGPWHTTRSMCPARNALCRFCKMKGHYQKVCRKKLGVREVNSCKDTTFLGSVKTKTTNNKWSAIVHIKNKGIEFKIDTGAEVNVIPKSIVASSFPNVILHPVDRTLAGPDGKVLKTEGIFYEKVRYRRKNCRSKFYVVSQAEHALLSGETSEKLGIVKRVYEIASKDDKVKCSYPVKEFQTQRGQNHREPMIASTFPDRPWQKVAMDLFYIERKWYLLITDFYSRYPEIALLRGLTASDVIVHIKSIFARHGIPEVVYSDNGPQFVSNFNSEFSKFARDWNFEHITSSPKYAQSNGFVESAVKIIKRSFKKEDDRYLALLSYRSTPLENGFSPSELLFGRQIRSRLPVIPKLLKPRTVNHRELNRFEKSKRLKQKEMYDKRHRTSKLEELPNNKRVWITDLKEEGRVVSKANTPRSYIVQTKNGLRRRNRFHLIPLRGMSERVQQKVGSPVSLENDDVDYFDSVVPTVPNQNTDISDPSIPSASGTSDNYTSTADVNASRSPAKSSPRRAQPSPRKATPSQLTDSTKVTRSRSGRQIKRPERLGI